MIGLVKDIVHRSTGKPLGFVCHVCEEAFLYPSAAVNDYLCSLSNHPSELSANKTGPRQTTAGRAKELDEMRAWAGGLLAQAATVVRAYKERLACGPVPQSLPAVDEGEFEPVAAGTDLAALLAPLGGPAEVDDVLEEEDFDPIAAYLIG